MKRTLVAGASPNEQRYSHLAVIRLLNYGHDVVPVGLRKGIIQNLEIYTDMPHFEDIHTVTLYVGPSHQKSWIPYIFSLEPSRIIFNPGTENLDFVKEAEKRGIEALSACTLVMLSIGNY